MFTGCSELMCCVQAWLAPTPYSPGGSVFLLILFYCMTVSAEKHQMTNHASEHPPSLSSSHVLENMQSETQAPAQWHDEEANDETTDAEKTAHECVWARDFWHWCSAKNLALLPDGCLSSLLQHDVSKLPHRLLSSLLSNMCSRVPCPGFEATKFLPYLHSPTSVYRYPVAQPVWNTGKLRTLAFWNGMEPTVRFVWTIPTVDLPSKSLFSEQVTVIVRGKERELSMFTYSNSGDVYIAVIYYPGNNKEYQACELDVRLAFKLFSMHDQTFDAAERSLRAGIQLPCSMLLEKPIQRVETWHDPEPMCFASEMGRAADLVEFTRLVVGANIRFVASDAC